MSPSRPSLLDTDAPVQKGAPLGWEGASFPLSKLDLTKLAVADVRRKASRHGSIGGPGGGSAPASARWHNLPTGPGKSSPRRHRGTVIIHSPRSNHDHHGSRMSGNMRLVSKTSSGWSWLSVKFREIRANKAIKPPRKGELPQELVEAIWGAHNLRHCQLPVDSLKNMTRKKVSLDPDAEIKKINAKKRDQSGQLKTAESLMDILLQNWTYFEHAHAKLGKTEKQVHAKYCENEFGHFLLSDGQQIHGQFTVHLHVLIKALRKLLTKLRSQILPTYYQELPAWKSPRLEEDPELEIPSMPLMPQLYPIEGLAPIPSEEEEAIPNDLQPPVFKSPIPKEQPPLVLPEPLKVPALKLPIMPAFTEDESSINYDAYKEEPMPVFSLPPQEPVPVWVEPQLAEFPPEPEYIIPQVIPPPVLESVPPFKQPLLDPRPCERSYYELGKDERGICDGLCSKHGHKHHFVPGQHRREPCFAKPPALTPLPPLPFPEAETIQIDADMQMQELTDSPPDANVHHDDFHLQIIPEPVFVAPPEESIPQFQPPNVKAEPVYEPLPPAYLPAWKEPKPPPPIGWIAGQRPVFLIDCSTTMAGERMEAVLKCLNTLFSPGGQVEVAVTHFDIIMYSFDAWSFGDIENSYIYKQASGSRYLRPLEPMRVKSPAALEAALNWVTRWRPAGTTNLSKAINLAMSRTLADCIYLFSEGKSDKPILLLESLKRQAQTQGYSVPIFSVAMHASKPKCRFLKRLSAVTGGQFIDYDYKKDQKLQEEKEEDLADMLWAQRMVEDNQRKNAQSGQKEDIKEIIKKVEGQYITTCHAAHLEAYRQKVKEREDLFQKQLQAVRDENTQILSQAQRDYERLTMEITERNKQSLQTAKAQWEEELEKVRQKNKQMTKELLHWRKETARIKQQNEQTYKEAKLRFARDLKEIEDRNARIMEKAKQDHMAEIERLKKKHMDGLEDVSRRQKEINEKVAALNRASREEHESQVAAIRESNAALLAKTRRLYEEKLESVKVQNARAIHDAQVHFDKRCEEVRLDNARKKAALAQRLEDIKRRREEAVAAHKLDVTRTIAQHEEKIKQYNALNLENEERARLNWKKACEEIDRDNIAAAQKAMRDFEAEQIRVQEENVKLAERRLDLKRRIAAVVKQNDEIVKRKKVEWKEACVKLEKEYEIEVAKAKERHKALVEQVKLRNAEKLQNSLLEHKAKVAAVEQYNETVRPYVEASNAIRAEIQRIEAFLQCIADSILPQDRHILEKNPMKSPLEKDLDLLAVSDATLNTQILIEALRSAYGKNWKTEKKGEKKLSQRLGSITDSAGNKTKLSGLIPIHPTRAIPHSCLEPEETS